MQNATDNFIGQKIKKPYWKPDRLVHELKKLFNDIPVVNPVEALKRLVVLKDNTDGGLLFCYSKRGEIRKYGQKTQEYIDWEGCSMCKKKPCSDCNGKLLPEEEIKAYFSSLAQTRKTKVATQIAKQQEKKKKNAETQIAKQQKKRKKKAATQITKQQKKEKEISKKREININKNLYKSSFKINCI